MNQKKTGTFLKELRIEKNLTQEQLAEKLGVSRRTVSRWETGFNLPDLDILIEMADYYNLDLREMLDGKRSEKNADLKETVLKVADYSSEESQKRTKILRGLYIAGLISFVLFFCLLFNEPEDPGFWFGYFEGMTLGIPFAVLLAGVFMTSKYMARYRLFKGHILNRTAERE